MNLNNYRLEAYKNAAKKDAPAGGTGAGTADTSGTAGTGKTVRKPVFEHLSSSMPPVPPEQKTQKPRAQSVQQFKPTVLGGAAGTAGAAKRRGATSSDVRAAAAALTSGGLLKVPGGTEDGSGKDSVYRKVAKFLLIIGVDEAAKILPHLPENQTERIIPEIASIRHVDEDEKASILAEFHALAQRASESGGVDTAKNILAKAFGEQRADEMLKKAVPEVHERPFAYLDTVDTERLLFLLKDESTATRALVLSHIKPKTAAAVINALPQDEKTDVILRLAKISAVSPEVINRVDQSMHEKYLAINTEAANIIDGSGVLAEILKRMPVQDEQDILSSISDDDPDLGQDLRKKLFTIEDVINADDRVIQEELRLMDNDQVAILLAGKPDNFRVKIFRNVSTGRGDIILEQETLLAPVRKSDSDKVTELFFSHLRQKYEDGKLFIKDRTDDIYIQ